MAILIFLDTAGPVVQFGDAEVVTDIGGLEVIAGLLAGAPIDVDAIAARCGSDPQDLHDLAERVRHLGTIAPLPELPEPHPVPAEPHPAATYAPDLLLQAQLPQPVFATSAGFVVWPVGRPDGVVLDAQQVGLLGLFAMPTRGETIGPDRQPGNPLAADPAARDAALVHLCEAGLIDEEVVVPYRTGWDQGKASTRRVHPRTRTLVRQQVEQLEARPPRNGRVPVFPVERSAKNHPPLALGMLMAACEAHDGGALTEVYDFVPDWQVRPASIRRSTVDGPAVFLFSNYTWSSPGNRTISAKVKELSPHSLVIHGGPDTPKFPGDREQYFADNPSVDVIVHGEGEVTIAEVLAAVDGKLDGDLRALHDVAGITFKPTPDAEPVTTADRARVEVLDDLPSPYLTGLFDAWKEAAVMVTIESNRGCPYGCTFCDWGSATNSRIRKFDLDRVFAEIEWAATSKIPIVMIADANFGIFERDVDIVRRIAELKESCGFPERMLTNYAKNTVKHLEPIVQILSDAKLDVNGIMSVQSFDTNVLAITKRKNLKSSEFERLAKKFRANQMPMLSDVMLGLPGSNVDTTLSDLQGIMEHEVNANIHATQLLPNSPMNEPSYRAEWEIVVDEHARLVSTKSYTADQRAEMDRIVDSFHAAETYGVLRLVVRWLGARLEVREIDALETMRLGAIGDPGAYPLLAWVLTRFLDSTTPPGPWWLLLDEVGRFIDDEWSIQGDDAEWQTIRTLQLHALPDHGRSFPDVVELPHDAVTWLHDLIENRREGTPTAALRTYPPATVEIDDPHHTCATLGTRRGVTDHHSFELAWPGARHIVHRWAPD
ncbi:B12-binding domain-containing radical SAM protein [Aquihabitans sp. McL0605]|uniref:B12-binding domain-containing radical SAM protein n=1 Tax=Aquihabitans sp. McL0605 TaxID=3415671 RepID=UPI003CFA0251